MSECTLCPVLSEGTVVAVAILNTELERPSVTLAGAASIVRASSPNPYERRARPRKEPRLLGEAEFVTKFILAAFGMRFSLAVSSFGADPPILGLAVDKDRRASTLHKDTTTQFT